MQAKPLGACKLEHRTTQLFHSSSLFFSEDLGFQRRRGCAAEPSAAAAGTDHYCAVWRPAAAGISPPDGVVACLVAFLVPAGVGVCLVPASLVACLVPPSMVVLLVPAGVVARHVPAGVVVILVPGCVVASHAAVERGVEAVFPAVPEEEDRPTPPEVMRASS